VIPNAEGRVLAAADSPSVGEYVVGWIKRGPSGVIGTNKPDAVETVDHLLADHAAGLLPDPAAPVDVETLLKSREVRVVNWEDWRALDEIERREGAALGRPRLKFTRVADMLAALAPSRAETPA
jgi:ferredoxin--NADP+ reductase